MTVKSSGADGDEGSVLDGRAFEDRLLDAHSWQTRDAARSWEVLLVRCEADYVPLMRLSEIEVDEFGKFADTKDENFHREPPLLAARYASGNRTQNAQKVGAVDGFDFAGWRWTEPSHAIGSNALLGVGRGFLTPTPVHVSGSIQVFGSPRDPQGRGSICAVEITIDRRGRAQVQESFRVLLPPGQVGCFDENGVILGDVIIEPDRLTVAYVGFADQEGEKFVARSGIASVGFDGQIIKRACDPTAVHPGTHRPIIEAIHATRSSAGGIEALYSMGQGWEFIDGAPFPRYDTYKAQGSTLDCLTGSLEPMLPRPEGVYRLGRPRWFSRDGEKDIIVATGGRRDGDYRPYVFVEAEEGRLVLDEGAFPFGPSDYPWCANQLSYPCIEWLNDETAIMTMNGDGMGADGFFLSVGHR